MWGDGVGEEEGWIHRKSTSHWRDEGTEEHRDPCGSLLKPE